jgi:hypothetical protein
VSEWFSVLIVLYIWLALNKEIRKDAQIKFYSAMTVLIFIYGSEVWTIKKLEAIIETAEMKVFRNVAGYTRKDQIRKIKLGKN